MSAALSQAEQYAAKRGESTVTMVFPRKVILLTDDGHRLEFEPGPQEVPESLSSHYYLSHSGAVRYAPNRPAVSRVAESEKEPDEAVDREPPEGSEPGEEPESERAPKTGRRSRRG